MVKVYQSEPTEVHAEQWHQGQNPETYPECVRWVQEFGAYYVEDHEGNLLRVRDGDYILLASTGKPYDVYNAEKFERTFYPRS